MTDEEVIRLDPVEVRVLGSLLEKERTVPSTYPMTTNGLVTACNQTSGRDPVMTLTDDDVLAATERLKAAKLTRLVHASHGARVAKHRQVLDERIDLDDAERAVITLLLLRGPQTPGELRSRSGRLHTFADRSEVEQALDALAARPQPLVTELDRRPGQKERRWAHQLGDGAGSVGAAEPVGIEPGGDPDPDAPPIVVFSHAGLDADGHTVTRRRTVDGFTMRRTIGASPPMWATAPESDPLSRSVWVMPVGWHGGWHTNPQRQLVVPLSGRWWVETQDGVRTVMGPGELHLGDDVDARPDARGRVGHDSGTEGDQPVVLLMIPLADVQDPIV